MAFALGTAIGKIILNYDGSGVDKAKQGLGEVQKKGMSTKDALNKVGNTAGLAGAAIAGGFAVAINSAADFEKGMSGIQAVSGATNKQMETIRAKALQLGKDTQFSASEASNAIEELVKAGISVPDVMNGAADATVALAAAGEVSMPEAAAIASNAMNQFNLKAKDMPVIADKIAGAANASAIDVKDFGYSLGQVGAVAHLAGASFEDTATAIALMGNAGIKGSDAGTSLKSMFMRLEPTTKKQFETMTSLGMITGNLTQANKFLQKEGLGTANTMGEATKKFEGLAASMGKGKVGTVKNAAAAQDLMLKYGGLQSAFYNTDGSMKSLAQVSQVLQNSLKGMTKEQQQATLQTLFGSDAIRGAAILANNGAKGFDKMSASMNKVKAADVAKTRMNNLKGSIEQMKGSLETAAIAIGTMIIPPLRALVDWVTNLLNHFLALSPGMQKAIAIFVGVVGVILLVIAIVAKMIVFINEFRTALMALKVAMAETWIAALGPIALIIAAIAAVVAIVIILWKHSETFRNIVLAVWGAIKSAAMAVAHWFAGPFVNFFVSAYNAVKNGLSAVGNFFKSIWNGIKKVVGAGVAWIKQNWDLLLPIFLGPLGLVILLVKRFWSQISAAFTFGLNIIKGIWNAVWGAFGPTIKAVWGLIVAIIRLAWTIIKGVFLLELNGIKRIVSTAWNVIKAVTSTVWNAIKRVFNVVWGAIHKVISTVVRIIHGFLVREWNGIKAISSAVWHAILAVIKWVWDHILSHVVNALKQVWDTISGIWNKVKSVTKAVWDWLVDHVKTRVNNLVHNVTAIKDRIVGFFSNAGHWLWDAGRKIIQGMIDGINSMIHKVTGAINSITDKISGFLPGSPVREGPLRVLNQGYAGKQIVKMLADGMANHLAPVTEVSGTVGHEVYHSLTGQVASQHPMLAGAGSSNHVENTFNVYNPKPERASQSVTRAMRSRVEQEGWGR